jgi:hypothetical protein
MLAYTKLSLQKCLITKTMAAVLHPTYLPYMALCHFFLFPRRKSELWWQHLESWNSGKIADCPTDNSEKSVWTVLPAVTEMLVPLHKLRRGLHWSLQQWPVIKINTYIVTDPGRLLSDTPLYIHSMTDNPCVCHRCSLSDGLLQSAPVIMTFWWTGFAGVIVEKHLSSQSEISIKKSYFTTTDQMQYVYIFILFILNFGFEGGEKTCKGLAVRVGENWEPQ